MKKIMIAIAALMLVVLTASCGLVSSVEGDVKDLIGDGLREYIDENSFYFSTIHAWEDEIDRLIQEEPIDQEALANQYRQLSKTLMIEYLFKGNLYLELNPKKDEYAAGQKILDEISELDKRMMKYLGEENVTAWIIERSWWISEMQGQITAEGYETEGVLGSVDIGLSWEAYFEENYK